MRNAISALPSEAIDDHAPNGILHMVSSHVPYRGVLSAVKKCPCCAVIHGPFSGSKSERIIAFILIIDGTAGSLRISDKIINRQNISKT